MKEIFRAELKILNTINIKTPRSYRVRIEKGLDFASSDFQDPTIISNSVIYVMGLFDGSFGIKKHNPEGLTLIIYDMDKE